MKINTMLTQVNQPLENSLFQNVTKETASNPFDFKSSLNTAQINSNQGILQELIIQFERQEKSVEKNTTMTNIQEYKRIIKDILNIAALNYKCESMKLYSHQGYQKVVNYSKIIDDKLTNIIDDFLATNKLSLESMSHMEEIKGLVLDIII